VLTATTHAAVYRRLLTDVRIIYCSVIVMQFVIKITDSFFYAKPLCMRATGTYAVTCISATDGSIPEEPGNKAV